MKATDIVLLDLRGISQVTEYFVICTVDNPRQLRGLWHRVREFFKKHESLPFGEDTESSKWVLLDYNEIVVHVFLAEYREFYDLELLWGDAPRVDWQAEPKKVD
jgi:ribosome-associated protein